MRHGWIIVALLLSACAASTVTSSPTLQPATSTPITYATAFVTPLPAPTSAPTESALISTRVVTFTTTDGVILHGTFYGRGTTAVILSEMGAQQEDTWAGFAQSIAAQGYLAFTYDFRYWVTKTRVDAALRDKAADDLRAAIAFVRAQGADRVVLVGASLGALATIKVADEVDPTAVVILSAPMRLIEGLPSLEVKAADIEAIQAPKLFIAAERDQQGFTADIQKMFEAASDPKSLQLYSGTAHGTDLFSAEHAADLTQRLIDFIEQFAPPNAAD
jgi:dienelactone hydrolase